MGVLYEKMKHGELYPFLAPEIVDAMQMYQDRLYDYNHTRPSEFAKRAELLPKLLAECGEGCYVEPPFIANWGAHHVHFGNNVYVNNSVTLVDDADIYIGDNVMIAPHVVISSAGHPIDPELREKQMQFNISVHIGNNVWLGAGAIVLPGITIGDNSVIGAGSVVTRDIPPNVVAVGNPCRVMRPIGPRDHEFYWRDRRISD